MMNVNFNSIPKKVEEKLIEAILMDDADLLIERIMISDVNINDRLSLYKDTLLHQAVFEGKIRCVRALLLNGADSNTKDLSGYTPLKIAADKALVECVEAILKGSAIPLLDKTLIEAVELVKYKCKDTKFSNIVKIIEQYQTQAKQGTLSQPTPKTTFGSTLVKSLETSKVSPVTTLVSTPKVVTPKPASHDAIQFATDVIAKKSADEKQMEYQRQKTYESYPPSNSSQNQIASPFGASFDKQFDTPFFNQARETPFFKQNFGPSFQKQFDTPFFKQAFQSFNTPLLTHNNSPCSQKAFDYSSCLYEEKGNAKNNPIYPLLVAIFDNDDAMVAQLLKNKNLKTEDFRDKMLEKAASLGHLRICGRLLRAFGGRSYSVISNGNDAEKVKTTLQTAQMLNERFSQHTLLTFMAQKNGLPADIVNYVNNFTADLYAADKERKQPQVKRKI